MLPGGVRGPTPIAIPPPLLLPLPAVACLPSSLRRSRGSTSELGPNHLWDIGARRLSRPQFSTWPPRPTSFSSRRMPESLERPSIGPKIFRPPLSGRLVVGGGGACAPPVTWSAPSGARCGGNLEPYNGLSYAWGHGYTHSKRDGDPSLGCNPSGTTPPYPPGSCSMSSHPGNMSADTGGSAPTNPRVPPLPEPPKYPLPCGRPLAPTVSH